MNYVWLVVDLSFFQRRPGIIFSTQEKADAYVARNEDENMSLEVEKWAVAA